MSGRPRRLPGSHRNGFRLSFSFASWPSRQQQTTCRLGITPREVNAGRNPGGAYEKYSSCLGIAGLLLTLTTFVWQRTVKSRPATPDVANKVPKGPTFITALRRCTFGTGNATSSGYREGGLGLRARRAAPVCGRLGPQCATTSTTGVESIAGVGFRAAGGACAQRAARGAPGPSRLRPLRPRGRPTARPAQVDGAPAGP